MYIISKHVTDTSKYRHWRPVHTKRARTSIVQQARDKNHSLSAVRCELSPNHASSDSSRDFFCITAVQLKTKKEIKSAGTQCKTRRLLCAQRTRFTGQHIRTPLIAGVTPNQVLRTEVVLLTQKRPLKSRKNHERTSNIKRALEEIQPFRRNPLRVK